MRNITIGIDLAKSVFSTCTVDATGRVLQRQDLRREAFASWLVQLPAGTLIAMEACSGAHHWARRGIDHGLQPRLMAAQFVKPFRKSQAAKNDRNDAEAIATAARQGNMRFVPVKSIDQQARLAEHRVREGYKADALVATIGNGHDFRNGRQLAAWLGLTPSQHSSGGKARLGTISCRGDGYLRTLMIQGARSSLQRAQVVAVAKATPEQIWIRDLASRLPFGKVVVAIANKHARQAWAMLARGEDYDAHAWLKHPMVQRPASKRRQQACS